MRTLEEALNNCYGKTVIGARIGIKGLVAESIGTAHRGRGVNWIRLTMHDGMEVSLFDEGTPDGWGGVLTDNDNVQHLVGFELEAIETRCGRERLAFRNKLGCLYVLMFGNVTLVAGGPDESGAYHGHVLPCAAPAERAGGTPEEAEWSREIAAGKIAARHVEMDRQEHAERSAMLGAHHAKWRTARAALQNECKETGAHQWRYQPYSAPYAYHCGNCGAHTGDPW